MRQGSGYEGRRKIENGSRLKWIRCRWSFALAFIGMIRGWAYFCAPRNGSFGLMAEVMTGFRKSSERIFFVSIAEYLGT